MATPRPRNRIYYLFYWKFGRKIWLAIQSFVWKLIYKWKIIRFDENYRTNGMSIQLWIFGKKVISKKLSYKSLMKIEDLFDLELF